MSCSSFLTAIAVTLHSDDHIRAWLQRPKKHMLMLNRCIDIPLSLTPYSRNHPLLRDIKRAFCFLDDQEVLLISHNHHHHRSTTTASFSRSYHIVSYLLSQDDVPRAPVHCATYVVLGPVWRCHPRNPIRPRLSSMALVVGRLSGPICQPVRMDACLADNLSNFQHHESHCLVFVSSSPSTPNRAWFRAWLMCYVLDQCLTCCLYFSLTGSIAYCSVDGKYLMFTSESANASGSVTKH